GPRLHRARAARRSRRDRSRAGRQRPRGSGHARRHPRHDPLPHRLLRRQGDHRGDGARRRGDGHGVPHHHRSFPVGLLCRRRHARPPRAPVGRDRARAGARQGAPPARHRERHPRGRRPRLSRRDPREARRGHRQHPLAHEDGRGGHDRAPGARHAPAGLQDLGPRARAPHPAPRSVRLPARRGARRRRRVARGHRGQRRSLSPRPRARAHPGGARARHPLRHLHRRALDGGARQPALRRAHRAARLAPSARGAQHARGRRVRPRGSAGRLSRHDIMPGMSTRGTLLALLILALPAVAMADLPTGAEANRLAKEAFAQGSRAFDLGEWDKAIEAWQKGYEYKPDPVFLYNIAQAERLTERYDKAIFFYRSYLRNAPRAPNRGEVEERIAQIELLMKQKQMAKESPPNSPMPPPGSKQGSATSSQASGAKPSSPPVASAPKPSSPPVASAPKPSTPPPSSPSSSPPPSSPSSPSSAPSSGPTVATSEPPPPDEPSGPAASTSAGESAGTVVATAPSTRPHRIDITATGGVNFWLGGVPGGAQPSTGITISGGYAVLARPAFALRIGALLGYTYLGDIGTTDHFLSVMADPEIAFALWRDKLWAFVEVGLGGMIVSGVKSGSALLKPNAASPGTLAGFAARPAIGLEYRVHPMVSLFVAPSLTYALIGQSSVTDSSLIQVDVSLGATLRL